MWLIKIKWKRLAVFPRTTQTPLILSTDMTSTDNAESRGQSRDQSRDKSMPLDDLEDDVFMSHTPACKINVSWVSSISMFYGIYFRWWCDIARYLISTFYEHVACERNTVICNKIMPLMVSRRKMDTTQRILYVAYICHNWTDCKCCRVLHTSSKLNSGP